MCFQRGQSAPAMSMEKLSEIITDGLASCEQTTASSHAAEIARLVGENGKLRGQFSDAQTALDILGESVVLHGEHRSWCETENGEPCTCGLSRAHRIAQERATLLPKPPTTKENER
jgi:hypothetical protein